MKLSAHMSLSALLLAGCLLVVTIPSRAEQADWKLYGSLDFRAAGGQPSAVFLEQGGVMRQADGKRRVWSKTIPMREFDQVSADSVKFSAVVQRAANLHEQGYLPPFAKLDPDLSEEDIKDVVYKEVAADIGGLPIANETYYEVDCGQGKLRELGTRKSVKNMLTEIAGIKDWQDIPRDSVADVMRAMVCDGTREKH